MVSSACQKTALTEISPGVSSQGITFELMTAPQTKVTTDAGFKTVFDEGDEVGLYVVQHAAGAEGELLANGNLHDNLKLVLRGGAWVLDGSTQIYFPENDDVLDFYAYWPYSETVDPTALAYNASESSYDLLAAVNADVAKTSEPVKLVFDHLLALVEVNVEGRGETVTIKNVIPDAVFNIAGKPAILGNTPSDVEMPAVSESFRLYLPAQTLSKGELFYIKVGDQDSKYTNAADRSLLAGTALQYNIDTQLGDIDAMPNCYMLKPGETVEIPVTKAYEVWKQESYLGPVTLTGDPEAEFLWMDAEGLVTSVGFAAQGKVFYAFEGNIHCTGATIKWMADNLKLIESPAVIEELALSVPDNGGVYLVPAFAGLGAPWWNPHAKAMICGMTLGTERGHVCRAALEAIAYQIKDLIDLMTCHAGITLKELRVDGGPTKNKLLMQFQADMLNACINRSDVEEASAMGAVVMNGLARGVWKDLDEVAALRTTDNRILPQMADDERARLYAGWVDAVRTVNKQ